MNEFGIYQNIYSGLTGRELCDPSKRPRRGDIIGVSRYRIAGITIEDTPVLTNHPQLVADTSIPSKASTFADFLLAKLN